MALDPLALLAASFATHSLIPGWGWFLLPATLFFGRFFCGWLCPLGCLNGILSKASLKKEIPKKFRFFKYFLLFLLLASAGLGFNFAGFFDPLCLFLSAPLPWQNPLLFLPLLLVLSVNFVFPRLWCRAICPLGALLGCLSWFAPEGLSCSKCGKCSPSCPQGVSPSRPEGECIRCGNCRVVCSKKDRNFSPILPAFDRERRLLLLGAAFSLPFLFLKGMGKKRSKGLRPPGVSDENDFLGRCVRCGLCLRLCPTKALQPSFFEAGEAFWTPKLVPRSGYCLPTCNSCGQNCPTSAIPRLELKRKNKARIGLARVDPARCVGCLQCVGKCPHSALSAGEVPVVDLSRCVGCGACENLCPLEPAAIKVFP